jgi:hypothetical protein
MHKTIDIGKEFSPYPGGRDRKDGKYNGTDFRENLLAPALKEFDEVTIIIDNAMGYGSSFLEEAFGGLIRNHSFNLITLKRKMNIQYKRQVYEMFNDAIWEYIEEAESLKKKMGS